jgi:predicted nucleic acid-binding protein
MTNTFVLDTSLILALLNKNDTQHQVAKDKIFNLESNSLKFEIPMVCYLEALNKNPFPEIFTKLLAELINKRGFELTTEADGKYVASLPLQIRTKLKSNDCSIIAITKRLNAELLTLDKYLEKYYKTI